MRILKITLYYSQFLHYKYIDKKDRFIEDYAILQPLAFDQLNIPNNANKHILMNILTDKFQTIP